MHFFGLAEHQNSHILVLVDITSLLADQSPWLIGQSCPRWRFRERRDLQGKVLDRVTDLSSRRATVVLGPRQVGKSVLLLQTAQDLLEAGWPAHRVLYFDFSDDRILSQVPAREVVAAAEAMHDAASPESSNVPFVFLLDEVSRAPNWDRWLKRTVDSETHRVVATDSAASLLRDGSRESGLGRWDELPLEGLTYHEFRRLATRELDPLTRYLRVGGFPEFATGLSEAEVRRTLREDITYRAIERDLAGQIDGLEVARRLFVYLVQDSGSIYNASKRAQDLGVDRKRLSAWTQLFFDSRLITPLPNRAIDARGGKAKAARRLGAHPKLYAVDHGLVHAFSPLPDPYDDPVVRGQVFECAVFRHLRMLAEEDPTIELAFHRKGTEGDFVVDNRHGTIVLEVTSARTASGKIEKLMKVKKEVGAKRALLIYGGLETRNSDGIEQVPLPRFLEDPSGIVLGEPA